MAILQSYSTYVVAGSKWRVCKVRSGKWVVYQWVGGTWDKFGTYTTKRQSLAEIAGCLAPSSKAAWGIGKS